MYQVQHTENRSTAELIHILDSDFARASKGLTDLVPANDKEFTKEEWEERFFHLRQIVRTAFAYFEGVTFAMKLAAAKKCMDDGKELTQPEKYLVGEVEHKIDDHGEVVQRTAQIRLAANIKFAFKLIERAYEKPKLFDPSEEWWACLQSSIKVRDRLTHPRWPWDIEMNPDEVNQLIKAKVGFTELIGKYVT
jgi:hypothetical protein